MLKKSTLLCKSVALSLLVAGWALVVEPLLLKSIDEKQEQLENNSSTDSALNEAE